MSPTHGINLRTRRLPRTAAAQHSARIGPGDSNLHALAGASPSSWCVSPIIGAGSRRPAGSSQQWSPPPLAYGRSPCAAAADANARRLSARLAERRINPRSRRADERIMSAPRREPAALMRNLDALRRFPDAGVPAAPALPSNRRDESPVGQDERPYAVDEGRNRSTELPVAPTLPRNSRAQCRSYGDEVPVPAALARYRRNLCRNGRDECSDGQDECVDARDECSNGRDGHRDQPDRHRIRATQLRVVTARSRDLRDECRSRSTLVPICAARVRLSSTECPDATDDRRSERDGCSDRRAATRCGPDGRGRREDEPHHRPGARM
jgi:hypothetical protein